MLSVRTKVTVALLLTAIVAVALVGLVAHWRLGQKFNEVVLRDSFREYRKDVAAYFATYGSWEQGEATEPFTRFVVRRHALLGMTQGRGMQWERGQRPNPFAPESPNTPDDFRVPPLTGKPELAPGVPPARLPPFRFLLLDPQGRVLKETAPYARGEHVPPSVVKSAFPIELEGRVVALAVPLGQPMLSAFDLGYLDAVREALLFGALVAIGLAALLGIALGTGLTRALRRLIDAVQAVSRGHLGLQVRVTSRDEIGALAAAFNRMSVDLATSHDALQEQTRLAEEANRAKSSFLAAASHDLRQPLHALGLFVSTLRRTRTGPLADEALGNIEGSLEALRTLFEALLDISRLDAGVIEPRVRPWPVQELFAALAREMTPVAEQKGLRLRCVPSALSVESDPVLL
ncbi:MAG TPA: HAMP domain-containing sensor histidine kinase, partial [bacterium]